AKNEKLKEKALGYRLVEEKMYNIARNIPVVEAVKELKEVIEAVHKDLGHYGRRTTVDAVKQRYEVASDLWEEGGKVLDACIPCQLYKNTPDVTTTAKIHPYGGKKAFEL